MTMNQSEMRRSRFFARSVIPRRALPLPRSFLNLARIEETDCLVTDVQMPGLSGVELQGRLLSDGHDVPTIFISAFPSPRLEQQALKSGAIAYLRKPFKEEELLEYIGAALKRA